MYREDLIDMYGLEPLAMSALMDESLFREVMAEIIDTTGPIRTAVETGTYKGWSALLLSDYTEHVHTFDRRDGDQMAATWATFDRADRITYHRIGTDADKARIVPGIDFDFAFIDGLHIGGVAIDFNILRNCGRLLFHDYVPGFPPDNLRTHVMEFVDSLGDNVVVKRPPFAVWVDKTKEVNRCN